MTAGRAPWTSACLLAVLATASPANAKDVEDPVQRAQALMEQGRTAFRAGQRYDALRLFAQARQLAPEDRDIRRAIADVLIELDAAYGAAQAIAPEDDIGVRARQAAEMVRWGEQVRDEDPRHRFDGTDAAIGRLEALIAETLLADPPDAGLLLRLRRDLVVALRDRERWSDALALAATLEQPHPPYVRQAEADALLALRRPREARDAYNDVLAAQPDSRSARIGRFYAEVEMEDFAAAFATVDALAAEGAPYRMVGTPPRQQADHDWLDAQMLAAQARSFADMPGEAWRRAKPLADAAPASPYLHDLLGGIAVGRGWARRSHEEILVARSLSQDNLGFRIALAESLFRRRHWREAEALADELHAIIPDNTRLQRLRRDIDIHHGAELRAEASVGRSEGGGQWTNGDSLDAEVRLYSPPLGERWRVFAGAAHSTSTPFEEKLVRDRQGVGLEGRWPDVTVEVSAWNNHGLLSESGAAASVQWQPDDHWSLSADLQKFSEDTPLRALDAGVDADSAAIGAGYAWNESHAVAASVGLMDFSDGNRRLQFSARYAALVVDRPHLDIYLRPGLYASRNSLDAAQAAYYNPSRDASLGLDLDLHHVMWRSYERSLAQRLVLSVGDYWQEGYGSGMTGGVAYEQTWQPGPRTEWNYGVAWARRIYDGDSEHGLTAFVRLNRRF